MKQLVCRLKLSDAPCVGALLGTIQAGRLSYCRSGHGENLEGVNYLAVTTKEVPIIESTELRWFCLKTQPKHEKIAAQILRSRVEIEVFSPMVRFQRVTQTGKKWFEEALFPGYVFGRFPYRTHFRVVSTSLGVTKIVSFGGKPAWVGDGIVEELRKFVQDNETIEVISEIVPGDEITVLDGPFKGLRAVVTRLMPAKDRVAVLLDLLGTQREVEVTAQRVLPGKVHPLSSRAAKG